MPMALSSPVRPRPPPPSFDPASASAAAPIPAARARPTWLAMRAGRRFVAVVGWVKGLALRGVKCDMTASGFRVGDGLVGRGDRRGAELLDDPVCYVGGRGAGVEELRRDHGFADAHATAGGVAVEAGAVGADEAVVEVLVAEELLAPAEARDRGEVGLVAFCVAVVDRKSTRLNSSH